MLRLKLFGNIEVHQDISLVTGFRSGKAQALLCYLAVTGRAHTRPTLAGLLWGDMPETSARMNLTQTLSNLNHLLGAHLTITRQAIAFNREQPYWLDVECFEANINSAASSVAVEPLREAVELYRGDFLEGFYVHSAPEFEEWALAQRARLRELALQALYRLAVYHTQQGQVGQALAVNYTTRLLALEPWREEAHRQLILLLALAGQRSAALAQYETCRQLLADELGVEPDKETKALYEKIKAGTLTSRDRIEDRSGSENRVSFPTFQARSSIFQPSSASSPFVARERELTQLDELMAQVVAGQGRLIFVIGEAGIGKTRLVEEFARRAQEQYPDLIVAGGQCNAYGGMGDPYLPFREILALLTGDIEARWAAGTISQEHARRLYALLPETVQALVNMGPDLIDIFISGAALTTRAAAAAPVGADWLTSLQQLVSRQTSSPVSTHLTQSALLAQYTHVLRALAGQRPLLLILDDLQWADTGSINLLFHLGRRLEGQHLLVVGIYRPSDVALGRSIAGTGLPERHPLEPLIGELQRQFGSVQIDLGQAEGRRFIESFLETEPNRLDAAFRDALYRQTRGHALFTVETLRGLQERGDLVRDEQGRWGVGASLNWKTLPVRVEGIIGERINRLPARLQEALKAASVEGEFFTAEVVARVQGVDERQMVRQLSSVLAKKHHLVQVQDSQRLSGQPLSRYRFEHILFQKYLYQSLDETERVYLHEAVGRALEQLHGEQAETIAIQLARHFQAAGMAAKAVGYLQKAGEQAVRSYVNREAVDFFNDALALLQTLADTPERARQELMLQLAFISPITALKGYAAPEVGTASLRARELCLPWGETRELFYALRGLWAFYVVRGELRRAHDLGQQLYTLAQHLADPTLSLEAHYILGNNLCGLGQFVQGREHLEQAIALYQPQQHGVQVLFFGPDTGVFCQAWLAHSLWHLGYPDQALWSSQAALTLAQELAHPFSLALALDYAAMLHQFRQDKAATLMLSEQAMAVCAEHGFAYYLAWATILQGWATAAEKPEVGIIQIRQGLADLQATGGALRLPYYLALLASTYAQAGQIQAGLTTLDEALAVASKNEDRWYEAELYRLKGEMFLKAEGTEIASRDEAKAQSETYFRQAIEIARRQEAKSQELRAVISLSRLWQHQGKTGGAQQILADSYGWFSEGFDSPDLRQAKTLLMEWA